MEVDDQVLEEQNDVPIEDTIRDAISSLNNRPDETVPDKPVAEVAPANDRSRDNAGKFAAEPKDKAKRETLSVPGERIQAPAADVVGAPVIPSAKAPIGWDAQMKGEFDKLPPAVQAYVSKREQDAHTKISAQDDERLLGKRVNELANPYLPTEPRVPRSKRHFRIIYRPRMYFVLGRISRRRNPLPL
jgi:hypothetical protein